MQAMVSTRFDTDTLERLDEAAAALGNSRSAFIKDAVRHYLEHVTWYKAEIKKGLDAVEEGKVRSHEEVGQLLKEAGVELD